MKGTQTQAASVQNHSLKRKSQLMMARLRGLRLRRAPTTTEKNNRLTFSKRLRQEQRRRLRDRLRLMRGRNQEEQHQDTDSTASTQSEISSMDSYASDISSHLIRDDVSTNDASSSNSNEGRITYDYGDDNNNGANSVHQNSSVPSHTYSRRSTLDMLQNLNIQDELQQRAARRASAPSIANPPSEGNSTPMFNPAGGGEIAMFRGHSERILVSRQVDMDSRPTIRPFSSERNLVPPPSVSLRQEMTSIGSVGGRASQSEIPSSLPIHGGRDNTRSPLIGEMPLSGLTLLYHAISSGASPRVVESIVDGEPSSTGYQNSGGNTALHCGIERYDTSMDVIRFLIKANPATVNMKNRSGLTPIDLIWKRFVNPETYRSQDVKTAAERLRSLMENVLEDDIETKKSDEHVTDSKEILRKKAQHVLSADSEFREFWDLMTLSIRAANHGNSNRPLLHGAVASNCPSLLVRFVATLHPEQLRQREKKHGRLPLHLSAMAESPRLSDTSNTETTTQCLLRLCPDAATCQDYDGRLPINLAAESDQPWEGSIQELFMAYPQSLSSQDKQTSLVPFMLAATGQDSDINSIFSLLREGPLEVNR